MTREAKGPDWYRQPADSPEGIQAMLNALPAMVGYWDSEQRNRMANDAYIEYFGKTPQEMRGSSLRDLLGPELYEKSLPYVEGALAGHPQQFDHAIRTPADELRYTQASYIPDLGEGEVRGFFVLVTDITERRRIEEEVEHSRARLAEAEQIAKMGSWEWDIPNERLICSEGLFAIYGIDPEGFDDHYDPSDTRHIHPEDRALAEREISQAVETGTPVNFEFRVIRPDGRIRRIHSRAELTADADGKPLRLTGTVQDVTEIRAAAEALHQTANDLGRRAAELHRLPGGSHREHDLSKALTARQLEILALVAEGLNNAEIASRLYLTESTVKWHVRKILRALGAANRAQAVASYLSART